MTKPKPATPPTVTIRLASRADLGAVSTLLERAYTPYEDQFPWPDLWRMYLDDVTDVGTRWGRSQLWVADDGEEVVGSVDYYPADGNGYHLRAEIAELFGPEDRRRLTFPTEWASFRYFATDPDRRSMGVGGALVRQLVDVARVDGATHLVLHTLPFMSSGIRIYERAGFLRLPERDLRVVGDDRRRLLCFALAFNPHPQTPNPGVSR